MVCFIVESFFERSIQKMFMLASLAISSLITSSLLFFLYNLGHVITHLTRQLFLFLVKLPFEELTFFQHLWNSLLWLNPNIYYTADKCHFTLPSTLQFSQHYHSLRIKYIKTWYSFPYHSFRENIWG